MPQYHNYGIFSLNKKNINKTRKYFDNNSFISVNNSLIDNNNSFIYDSSGWRIKSTFQDIKYSTIPAAPSAI
jgi:hypothetical protein